MRQYCLVSFNLKSKYILNIFFEPMNENFISYLRNVVSTAHWYFQFLFGIVYNVEFFPWAFGCLWNDFKRAFYKLTSLYTFLESTVYVYVKNHRLFTQSFITYFICVDLNLGCCCFSKNLTNFSALPRLPQMGGELFNRS
jgi:hypothetical protein